MQEHHSPLKPNPDPETKPTSSGAKLAFWRARRDTPFYQMAVGTFTLGLLSAALLVGVVTATAWALNVLSNWDTTSTLVNDWGVIAAVVAALIGLLVAIGLPVAVMYKRGVRRVVLVISIEAALLLIGLVGTGFYLNSTASSPSSGGSSCGANMVPTSSVICN